MLWIISFKKFSWPFGRCGGSKDVSKKATNHTANKGTDKTNMSYECNSQHADKNTFFLSGISSKTAWQVFGSPERFKAPYFQVLFLWRMFAPSELHVIHKGVREYEQIGKLFYFLKRCCCPCYSCLFQAILNIFILYSRQFRKWRPGTLQSCAPEVLRSVRTLFSTCHKMSYYVTGQPGMLACHCFCMFYPAHVTPASPTHPCRVGRSSTVSRRKSNYKLLILNWQQLQWNLCGAMLCIFDKKNR